MSSYFEEHNCEPLRENERPDNYLSLARLLLDSGIANALGLDYATLNAFSSDNGLAPATSKKWLKEYFEANTFDETKIAGTQCPVCLKEFCSVQEREKESSNSNEVPKTAIKLPCNHKFHCECIKPWLEQTSNCPLCRYELPTDDENYEEFKRQRKREQARKEELESLHNSMYT